MTDTKRDVWNLCKHDPDLAQLVRDAGSECSIAGIEVKANGQRAEWGTQPDGRANWEHSRAENGDPRDQPGWMRGLREAGL